MTGDDLKYYRLIASDRVGLSLVGRIIVFVLCNEVERLQAENDQLQRAIKDILRAQAKINSQIVELQVENARLNEIIYVQTITLQPIDFTPAIDPAAIAAGQAGIDWGGDE